MSHFPTLNDLREKEKKLKHAASRDVTINSDGVEVRRSSIHYLSCEKCALRVILGLPKEDEDGKPL